MEHREKCIRQHVLIVAKNVKFPLNQMVLDPCIVKTIIRNIDQEDLKNLLFIEIFQRIKENPGPDRFKIPPSLETYP
jgi:hypothetical protein